MQRLLPPPKENFGGVGSKKNAITTLQLRTGRILSPAWEGEPAAGANGERLAQCLPFAQGRHLEVLFRGERGEAEVEQHGFSCQKEKGCRCRQPSKTTFSFQLIGARNR